MFASGHAKDGLDERRPSFFCCSSTRRPLAVSL
jgi:hypothetical protein